LKKSKRKKDYHTGNDFRFNKVNSDIVGCFNEIRINQKENAKGVCEFKTVINENEVIN
jgi:hypothetical protein